MKNYLYEAFAQNCRQSNTTMAAWAARNNLSNSMPTNLKNGVRPTQATLEKLVHSWSDNEMRIRILQAYLKDEIERLNFTLDVLEPVRKSDRISPQIDEDLKVIAEFMRHRPIRDSIHSLATLLKVSDWAKESEQSKTHPRTGKYV